MGGGDAGGPSSAEEDEDHWIICDGSGGVRRYPTVYRSPSVWQAVNVGVWDGVVLEPEGIKHLVERSLSDGSLPNTSGVFAQEWGRDIIPSDRVSR